MSEIIELNSDSAVQYILDDSKYTLQTSNSGNVIYNYMPDGTLLLNGPINNAIVLHEVDNDNPQLYINNENVDQFFVTSDENDFLDNSNLTNYVDEDDQYIIDESSLQSDNNAQVLYITDTTELDETEAVVNNNVEILEDDESRADSTKKRTKFVTGVIDFDDLVNLQSNQNEDSTENGYQYAVLKDGKLHIQSYDDNFDQSYVEIIEDNNKILDISGITGKNLLTGQTVHLNSYINNINKQLKTIDNETISEMQENQQTATKSNDQMSFLLNKKIPLVKKINGKKLFGKIVQISQKQSEAEEELIEQNDKPEHEYIELTSRTLIGLMDVESVKKNLENAHITVRIVLKKYITNNAYVKKISYVSGFMRQKSYRVDSALIEKWDFAVDDQKKNMSQHVTLTLMIKERRNNNRTIRVIFNKGPHSKSCHLCDNVFRTKHQLRVHLLQIHEENLLEACKICNKSFLDQKSLNEHKIEHIIDGKLVQCDQCKKTFTSNAKFRQHSLTHQPKYNKKNSFECNVCKQKCTNEWNLKKHMYTHMNIKPFVCHSCEKCYMNRNDFNAHLKVHESQYKNRFNCGVCGKSFSRGPNLQRHIEIHKGVGVLYQCRICGCSYNFASSLTRHMIQNHLNVLPKSAK